MIDGIDVLGITARVVYGQIGVYLIAIVVAASVFAHRFFMDGGDDD